MHAALYQAWSHVVGGPVADEDLDLAACALLIAELERPGLAAAESLAELDRLAAGAGRAGGVDGLSRYLFEEVGFRGNDADYYDPKNSCLDEVLRRRLGIPITLSLVFLEVGWRLGLDVAGVGFPARFLVRARETGPGGRRERILDPFGGGVTLGPAHLEAYLAQAIGRPAPVTAEHLRVLSKREILARMLNNLFAIYRGAGDAERVAAVQRLGSAIGARGRGGGGAAATS